MSFHALTITLFTISGFVFLFMLLPSLKVKMYSNHPREIFRIEKENVVHPKIIKIYRKQIEGRRALLASIKSETNYYDNLYNVAAPEVFCPGLTRIGYLSDGGKWICNPQRLPSPCVIYSLGINNEFSFDQEIYDLSKCQIRGFDMDQMEPNTVQVYEKMNATLLRAKISKETNKTRAEYSFADIVAMYNHSKIDVLKIDIEGGEYDVIDQIVKVPICQILIELHKNPFNMVSLLKTLSRSGFFLYSHEINGGVHIACEFSLIHESCLKDYGVEVVFGRYLC